MRCTCPGCGCKCGWNIATNADRRIARLATTRTHSPIIPGDFAGWFLKLHRCSVNPVYGRLQAQWTEDRPRRLKTRGAERHHAMRNHDRRPSGAASPGLSRHGLPTRDSRRAAGAQGRTDMAVFTRGDRRVHARNRCEKPGPRRIRGFYPVEWLKLRRIDPTIDRSRAVRAQMTTSVGASKRR